MPIKLVSLSVSKRIVEETLKPIMVRFKAIG